MQTEIIHLTKEKETLLGTLYNRALDNRLEAPLVGDKYAEEAIHRIDYDFHKLKAGKSESLCMLMRARYLDMWTKEYIVDNPGITVLHLGCGLDSRVYRIAPPASIRWYDVDYPEVVDIRKRIYPERAGYRMIGSSVTDLGWLDEIPSRRPVLVVAEGLSQYLPEADGLRLLKTITRRFLSGEMIFDAWNRLNVWLYQYNHFIKATGATLHWGIDDPTDLERAIPGLKLIDEVSYMEMPELARAPGSLRLFCGVLKHVTAARRLNRLLRYRFQCVTKD